MTEAKGHILPPTGSCSHISQCRTFHEIMYIAYLRSLALQSELNFTMVFVTSVSIDKDVNGMNKILMSSPNMLGIKKGKVHGAPLFK
jgi:hypothetical protein